MAYLTDRKPMRVMMVTTEYPPMQGGVGRYSATNLVASLWKVGLEVLVVCNEKGNGDLYGLYPSNPHNSEVLLNAVTNSKPDICTV